MQELRKLIREVLAEELRGLRGATASNVREETVSIRTSAELQTFVRRLLEIAENGRSRSDILEGRHVFRLAQSAPPHIEAHQPMAPQAGAPAAPARFDCGLVTEKEIARLPDGSKSVVVGKTVRLTPLARDELLRKGIRIERNQS